MLMDPVIVAGARKHGVPDEDIRVFVLDDLVMLIGADESGRMLEIGVASAEGIEFIVHAMPARDKFLR